ncbi:MAG: amidophosphoribosyltransferase [bacterium]
MCGIAGVLSGDKDAAGRVALALFAEQHRGQESCGVAYIANGTLELIKGMGLVKEVLTPAVIEKAQSSAAIGHVRYPTQGTVDIPNAQPHLVSWKGKSVLAIASNGDIVNYYETREKLELEGAHFNSENDGELLGHYLAWCVGGRQLKMPDAIRDLMEHVKGAFSAVVLTPDGTLYALRDPLGFRPFAYGYHSESKSTVFVSESVGIDILGAEFRRAVNPGEILIADANGVRSEIGVKAPAANHAHCVFELIYFSRPDSLIFDSQKPEKDLFGKTHNGGGKPTYIHNFRRELGHKLAQRDRGFKADAVIAIPDSGNFIALGYSEESGLPFRIGLVRNHYVGRTFIKPEQRYRDAGVREKFNPVPGFFDGKKVLVVDDSIVRGTTMKKLVAMIREAGAKEIHLRIGSPPMRYSCFYGIDTPTREQLIANIAGDKKHVPLEEIEKEVGEYLGVNSLHYLPLEGLKSIGKPIDQFCYACFSGDYAVGTKDSPKPATKAM